MMPILDHFELLQCRPLENRAPLRRESCTAPRIELTVDGEETVGFNAPTAVDGVVLIDGRAEVPWGAGGGWEHMVALAEVVVLGDEGGHDAGVVPWITI